MPMTNETQNTQTGEKKRSRQDNERNKPSRVAAPPGSSLRDVHGEPHLLVCRSRHAAYMPLEAGESSRKPKTTRYSSCSSPSSHSSHSSHPSHPSDPSHPSHPSDPSHLLRPSFPQGPEPAANVHRQRFFQCTRRPQSSNIASAFQPLADEIPNQGKQP